MSVSICTFPIQDFRFFKPKTKRYVTQLSKPDDRIGKPHNPALICLQADHFPLNSTLDDFVGIVKPVIGYGRKNIDLY